MFDERSQRAIVERVAAAADTEGCLVAPIGSVFFLFHDAGRAYTKDVDVVIHAKDLRVVDVATLERIGARLGSAQPSHDKAVVGVTLAGEADGPSIELVRGRGRSRGGFIPRSMLEKAAHHAKRDGNLLLYPREFVVVMKADAAIDREERARTDETRRAENLIRADVFRADVFAEAARSGPPLSVDLILEALSHIKKKRRKAVTDLLQSTGIALP